MDESTKGWIRDGVLLLLLVVILGTNFRSSGIDGLQESFEGLEDNLAIAQGRVREAEHNLIVAEEYVEDLRRNNREAGRIIADLEGENSELRIAGRELNAQLAELERSTESSGSLIDRGLGLLEGIEAGVDAADMDQ